MSPDFIFESVRRGEVAHSRCVERRRISEKETRQTLRELLADVGHGLPYRRRRFLLTSPGPVHVGSMSKDERVDDHVDESGPRGTTCKYGGALSWRLRVGLTFECRSK